MLWVGSSLEQTLHDVQERLTYRAVLFIRDSIANYEPTREQMDYPALLHEKTEAMPVLPVVTQTLHLLNVLYQALEVSPLVIPRIVQNN